MQLITILLIVVAVLTILSGISTMFGASKQNKISGIWFFIATLGAGIWCSSISGFLSLGLDGGNIAPILVIGIIAGITISDVALLGYTSWQAKSGKILTLVFLLVGIALTMMLATNPQVFYSSISLNNDCNKMEVVKGWYYFALIGYFTLITIAFSSFLQTRIKKTSNKNIKRGLKIFYVGLSIGGILALVFDLILLSSMPSLVWIGPMAASISILSFYYSVVRYKMIAISSNSMKWLSYVILVVAGVSLYLVAFYLVFLGLFRTATPSFPVMLLNFIMVAVVILLLPALNELKMFLRTMVSTSSIYFDYMCKKISNITPETLNLKELAGFLADGMRYSFVALLINGRVYSSEGQKFSAEELVSISKISSPKFGVWQEIDRANSKIASAYDISRVAVLYDKNHKVMGQMIFGKKLSKLELSRKDLIEYETLINLTAMVIEDGCRKS